MQDVGYKVWLSQFEVEAGRSVNVSAMQRGINDSEMIVVLLTPGVFHRDRIHVTHTEIKYAVDILKKPIGKLTLKMHANGAL